MDNHRKRIDTSKFFGVLPDSGDVELTLLKVHLLVEEMLTECIVKEVKNPKHIDKARLTFSQKMHLVRSLKDDDQVPWLWQAIYLLNKARNELSHKLNRVSVNDKIEAFVNCVKDGREQFHDDLGNEKFTKFHWAFFLLYLALANVLNFRMSEFLGIDDT